MQKVSKNRKKSRIGPKKKVDLPVEIMGVALSGTHKSQVLKKISLQRKEMLHVATVNPEYVMEARGNVRFRETLKKCLTVADGWGMVWASKLQGESSKVKVDRISGMWLSEQIIRRAAENGEKVFLLGAAAGVAEQAASKLSKIYPQLQISWYSGAQTVKLEKNEEASMTIAKINAYEPHYLLVAYGSPWQDMWIEENRPYLRVRVAMGVGGVLDEWAGIVPGCPAWMDKIGAKWLWRLLTQPWRLGRVMRVFHFGLWVLWTRLKRLL